MRKRINKKSKPISALQIESKMRIIANHFIDRMLEIQKEAMKKGLNVNEKKDILIMEHNLK